MHFESSHTLQKKTMTKKNNNKRDRRSSPIENFDVQFQQSKAYLNFLKDLREDGLEKSTCIETCKQALGRQDRTEILSERRRFYIWEKENYRLYVHNEKGIVVEAIIDERGKPTIGDAFEVWTELYSDFGLLGL